MSEKWRELNRALWDKRVPIHVASAFYDVDAFLAGRSALRPFEVEEIGDVGGLALLHTQCHFGLDTLSWARRGARVTGLDFSAPAIEAARKIAADAGLDAEFVVADVYEAAEALGGRRFDLVYTGLGALNWLPDEWDEPGTYADLEATTVHNRSVEWNHGLGTVVTALVAAGLRLEFLNEHDYTLFPAWSFLERSDDEIYRLPEGTPSLPLMYSLLASA